MYKFLKQNNKNIGFTLVETLVALSIFSVSILGMISVLASSISDTGYAKKKMTASYLAQEGIEYVRNMRDTYALYQINGGWGGFTNEFNSCHLNNGNGCGIDNLFPITDNRFIFQCSASKKCNLYVNNGNYSTDPSSGSDSGFIRIIRMETAGLGSDQAKVYSEVSWIQGSGTSKVTFSENLYNWAE